MPMRKMSNREVFASIVGAFFATLCASFFSNSILEADNMPMVLASTGASAMLIFGIPHSPVSQPWPLVGGHIISALIGISAYYLIPNPVLASSVAIGIAMLAMHCTGSMHPPGGATAVTAVIGGSTVHELGYYFVIVPVFFNSIILLSIAMAIGTFREKNPFVVDGSDSERWLKQSMNNEVK
ncbi:HPP family protein [Shewanella atlantica]|uniref:HPP family protein n=2 Tax=Shewanella atlantica TaxID=271099 RepID=A0A431WDY0_9GAMM|nr:HPP family protein [Shewanella atlantica]